MKTVSHAIAELEATVARLQDELRKANQALEAARIAECGVKIGDIVIGTAKHRGKKFKVSEIDARWSPPWLKGNPQRADGSFGTGERHLFDSWMRP